MPTYTEADERWLFFADEREQSRIAHDILAHADHVATYYDKKLTTPLGFWKTTLKTLVPVAGAAGSFSAGFVK